MPSLTLPDRLIWFAHCPKAGGTSVEQAMVARWGDAVGHLHWGWDLWWRDGGWREADPLNSPQHLVWADALVALPRAPDAVFALVREPVARMTSEHRWQRKGRRGTCAGKLLAVLPFSLWLRLMLRTAAINHHVFDNHFRAQADFVPETAWIFRLEDGLGPVTEWLTETAGAGEGGTAGIPLVGIPHALRTGTGTSTPVAPDDAALIGTVFATDYARFGYARPEGAAARPVTDVLARAAAPLVAWLDRRGRL